MSGGVWGIILGGLEEWVVGGAFFGWVVVSGDECTVS